MKKIDVRTIPAQIILLFLFALGFLAGVIITFLNAGRPLTQIYVNVANLFYQLENISVDKNALLFITLGKHLRNYIFLIIIINSSVRLPIFLSYTALKGFFIGASIELLLITYGIMGMGMYALLVLPQGIFYFLGYSTLLVQGMKAGKRGEHNSLSYDKKNRMRKLAIALLLITIGSVTEAYGNLFLTVYMS